MSQHELGSRMTLVHVKSLPLRSCVTLGVIQPLCGSFFPFKMTVITPTS